MLSRPLLPIVALIGLACAPGSPMRGGSAGPGPGEGSLHGTIVVGPGCPAETSAADCSPEPATGARLRVIDLEGGVVARPVADDRGDYAAALAAGRYRVELDPVGIEHSKELPAEVEVLAGRRTRLDVRIDSGIR